MSDLKMEYLKKIDEITSKAKSEIEKATEEYNRELGEQDTRQWTPRMGEKYYYIDSFGSICVNKWNDRVSDNCRLEIGNVFENGEEAKFELERLKVLAIMKKYSSPFIQGECNYYMGFYHRGWNVETDFEATFSNGIPYFESEEIVRKVIDEIGEERLKKYYFRLDE